MHPRRAGSARAVRLGTSGRAHPDAILRLGTKDVLVDVRDLPFGSDAVRVDSLAQLADELPERLCGIDSMLSIR